MFTIKFLNLSELLLLNEVNTIFVIHLQRLKEIIQVSTLPRQEQPKGNVAIMLTMTDRSIISLSRAVTVTKLYKKEFIISKT